MVGIYEYYRRAVAEGADILKPPTTEPWGRREMGLRSPDGHRFMLSERL
nr:VOC family protein [Mycobacterium sp. 852002-51057_SCH5723018]